MGIPVSRKTLDLFTSKRSFGVRALTVAITATLILGITGLPAMALNATQFHLDRDALSPPNDDWQNVLSYPGHLSGSGSDIGNTFVADGPNDPTVFTGGGSKDINPISDWACCGSVQAKDDITNAYAAAYVNGGAETLYFGADRFAHNGDAVMGFWFFQNKIGLNGTSFTGTHAVGDLLIVSDFVNGGSVSVIRAYKWNGSGLTLLDNGVDCFTSTSGPLCATVNQANTQAPWSYTPKFGTSGTFPMGSFLEGGVNLSDESIFGSNVPCFSTFMAETRSSHDVNSTASDFALGGINTCGKIEGTKYNDLNVSGSRDQGEPGLSGWTIELFGGNVDMTTLTDDQGNYQFVDVPPGTYTVCEHLTAQTDWFQSQPSSGANCSTHGGGLGYNPVTVGLGQTVDGGDFGNYQKPHLSITKTANPAGPVSSGDPIGFDITVSNAGPGPANDVIVSDNLPKNAGLNWSLSPANTPAGCAITGAVGSQVLGCTFETLAAGHHIDIRVVSPTTKDSGCGAIENTAKASAEFNAEVQATDSVTINCAQIDIAKVANPVGPVSAGDPIGFDITVTNNGAGTASNIVVNDPLPAGGDLNWSLDPAFAGCSITDPVGTQVLGCTFASLAGKGTSIGPIHVTSATTRSDCGTVTNADAKVTTGNDGTDDASASVKVNCPDLSILKVANPKGPVSSGDAIGFDITVTNHGAGTASNVVVNDPLPAGGDLNWSLDPAFDGCSITGPVGTQVLGCTFASLAGNGSIGPIHVTSATSKSDCALVSNIAHVSADNDPSVQSSASVEVDCPNISITKTADRGLVESGDPIGFTVTVSNTGAGNAAGVTLTDALPGGNAATPVHWTIDGSTGDPASFSITGADGSQHLTLAGQPTSLAAGASLKVHVTAATSSTSCATYDNTASVTTTNDGSDNATASVGVICPSISIVKTANPTSGAPGDTVTYTFLVKNTGDTTLFNVTVVDDKLGVINTTAIASLAPGQSVTLTKTTTLPNAGGALTNVGTATGTDVLGKKVSAHDNATVTVVLAVLVKTGTNGRGIALVGFLFIAVGVAMATRKERGRVRPAFGTSSSAAGRAVMLAAHRRSWRMRRKLAATTRARLRWRRRSSGPPMRDGP